MLLSVAATMRMAFCNGSNDAPGDGLGDTISLLKEALRDVNLAGTAIIEIEKYANESYERLCRLFFVGGLEPRKIHLETIAEELRFVLDQAIPALRSPSPSVIQAWFKASSATVEWRVASTNRLRQEVEIHSRERAERFGAAGGPQVGDSDADHALVEPDGVDISTCRLFAFDAAQVELSHLIVALKELEALDLALAEGRLNDLFPARIFEDQVRILEEVINEGARMAEVGSAITTVSIDDT